MRQPNWASRQSSSGNCFTAHDSTPTIRSVWRLAVGTAIVSENQPHPIRFTPHRRCVRCSSLCTGVCATRSLSPVSLTALLNFWWYWLMIYDVNSERKTTRTVTHAINHNCWLRDKRCCWFVIISGDRWLSGKYLLSWTKFSLNWPKSGQSCDSGKSKRGNPFPLPTSVASPWHLHRFVPWFSHAINKHKILPLDLIMPSCDAGRASCGVCC